jgi:hypothetical protein
MTRYYQVSDYQLITEEYRYQNSSESLQSDIFQNGTWNLIKREQERNLKTFEISGLVNTSLLSS